MFISSPPVSLLFLHKGYLIANNRRFSFNVFLFAALVVRFITRRFIGEYDPNLEQVYTHSTIMNDEAVLFEILDAAGHLNVSHFFSCYKNRISSICVLLLSFVFCFVLGLFKQEENNVNLDTNIKWADAFILMYSVTDATSFEEVIRLRFLINYNKRRKKMGSTTKVSGRLGCHSFN